ncbi:MAG: hypothetical protein ACRESX_08975 [Gammaproteobacteria bacterium]
MPNKPISKLARRDQIRRLILIGGRQKQPRYKSRAFAELSLKLFNPNTGRLYSRQAVEHWYRSGRVPYAVLERLAAFAELPVDMFIPKPEE